MTAARRWPEIAALGLVLGAALAGAGCSGCNKKAAPPGPPPEITGLAVVPASAVVVVGAEIAKLQDTPLVDRIAVQLAASEPELSERWNRLHDDCKIDIGKQIKRAMLALGPPRTGSSPGTGPVLMIAVGALPEADLKDCVTKLIGGGGGTLTGSEVAGHTVYLVKDGNSSMYFAYSRPDTVVLSRDEAYLTEALGAGKKAPDNADLTAWRSLVNQNSAIWAAGRTDPRVRDGLVQSTGGKIAAGPVAFAFSADLIDGANLVLDAIMAEPEQANNLESYVKNEIAALNLAAQLKSLGRLVGKLAVSVDGAIVQFRVALSVDDINLLLSVLDAANTPAQNLAPPQPSAGSGSGAQ